jgi:hypothetical protein
MTNTNLNLFNTLPLEVQNKAKQVLKAYDNVNVVFEDGIYNVSPNSCLKATYSADHKVIGRFNKNEIFTEDEQIVNYIESFHSYPTNFKGKRNYQLMNQLSEMGWDAKIRLTSDGFEII